VSTAPIRVAVFGAAGRMGTAVCEAVVGDPALELVAAVDTHHTGLSVREAIGVDANGLHIVGDKDAASAAKPDVAVDFTIYAVARENASWCAAHGVHAVIGTSGFTADDFDALRAEFTSSNCIVAPNFAIGAVLMMRFAELAAPYFDTAEIIELHHDTKVDAPSGTAIDTARRMAAASNDWAADPTTKDTIAGARGAVAGADIRIHSVRMRGMVAHQEVLLGTTGQTLSIRHDTTDRTSFIPGVLLAVKKIAEHPGLTVGLDALLGL